MWEWGAARPGGREPRQPTPRSAPFDLGAPGLSLSLVCRAHSASPLLTPLFPLFLPPTPSFLLAPNPNPPPSTRTSGAGGRDGSDRTATAKPLFSIFVPQRRSWAIGPRRRGCTWPLRDCPVGRPCSPPGAVTGSPLPRRLTVTCDVCYCPAIFTCRSNERRSAASTSPG